ncbi:MAG TPA: helix-turn-helix transcriptional regulator [Gemmataceae bacterium]|jgi:transcriptional regulator with XRE-family HTH domain
MRFAQRLNKLRENAGLSQPDLADASGLPVESIRPYEQGRREPYWQVVFKLAAALGVDCTAFKDCIDAAPPEPPPAAKAKRKGQS